MTNNPHVAPKRYVYHEGVEYDLQELEKPLCFLPPGVVHDLRAWPHGLQVLGRDGRGCDIYQNPLWTHGHVYRAKPAPPDRTVILYFGEMIEGALTRRCKTDTHRLKVRYVNGEPIQAWIERIE